MKTPQGDRLRDRRARASSTSIFGGAGRVNQGVNPGMPAADDQSFYDYDPAKAKADCSKSSTWDKTKPLRIVFDNIVRRRRQLWTPVMQQNLEAIGFKVELHGLETTAADRGVRQDRHVRRDHRPGRRPGRRPVPARRSTTTASRLDPPLCQTYSAQLRRSTMRSSPRARSSMRPSRRRSSSRSPSMLADKKSTRSASGPPTP